MHSHVKFTFRDLTALLHQFAFSLELTILEVTTVYMTTGDQFPSTCQSPLTPFSHILHVYCLI